MTDAAVSPLGVVSSMTAAPPVSVRWPAFAVNAAGAAKLCVIGSMLAAVLVEAELTAADVPALPYLCLASIAAAFLCERRFWGFSAAAGLFFAYIVPATWVAVFGRYYFSYSAVWSAWMLGAVVARASVTRWAFPARWRAPLVFWALVVSMTWAIVVAREGDFGMTPFLEPHIGNSGLGGYPSEVARWIASVALNYGLGILWFDSWFETYADDRSGRFTTQVVVPLALGMIVAGCVAIYQGVVDLSWLSAGHWAADHRAAGTLADGDAFGALAAFWATAFAALIFSPFAGRAMRLIGLAGVVVAWGGAWASGSRMALVAAIFGLIVLFAAGAHAAWSDRLVRRSMVAVTGAFAIFVLVAVKGPWSTHNPIARTWSSLPAPTTPAVLRFINIDFWDREAPYGSASARMFGDSPFVGIGLGAFHELFPDYSYLLTGRRRMPDNAQSWYRHELAELGIVGSAGWIAWGALLAGLLVTAVARPGAQLSSDLLRGSILSMAAISTVSMPAQDVFVGFTFWAFVFWWWTTIEPTSGTAEACHSQGRLRGIGTWFAIWMMALLVAAGTLFVGWSRFRPPIRAQRADWEYQYGFYEPEQIDGRVSRWTRKHAVAVLDADRDRLRVRFWANHQDLATNPMDVQIWCDRRRVVRTRLASAAVQTISCPVPVGARRVMLETSVDHTVRPRDFGLPDDRELGLAVSWEFAGAPAASR